MASGNVTVVSNGSISPALVGPLRGCWTYLADWDGTPRPIKAWAEFTKLF
jgi:hypothetical protein